MSLIAWILAGLAGLALATPLLMIQNDRAMRRRDVERAKRVAETWEASYDRAHEKRQARETEKD